MPIFKGLIVEDSEVQRDVLKDLLESDDEIEIIGMSDNGQEAIQLDGLQATRKILKSQPIPIFVVSASENDEVVFKALSLGAIEVISKSDMSSDNASHLIQKIKKVLRSEK